MDAKPVERRSAFGTFRQPGPTGGRTDGAGPCAGQLHLPGRDRGRCHGRDQPRVRRHRRGGGHRAVRTAERPRGRPGGTSGRGGRAHATHLSQFRRRRRDICAGRRNPVGGDRLYRQWLRRRGHRRGARHVGSAVDRRRACSSRRTLEDRSGHRGQAGRSTGRNHLWGSVDCRGAGRQGSDLHVEAGRQVRSRRDLRYEQGRRLQRGQSLGRRLGRHLRGLPKPLEPGSRLHRFRRRQRQQDRRHLQGLQRHRDPSGGGEDRQQCDRIQCPRHRRPGIGVPLRTRH